VRPPSNLVALSPSDLASLASAIRSGRLAKPFRADAVGRLVARDAAEEVMNELRNLCDSGISVSGLAQCLDLIREAQDSKVSTSRAVQLVMTSPQESRVRHRDTKVVVEDLFRRAENAILLSGYAFHNGRDIFGELAKRMAENPGLRVRFFVNIPRLTLQRAQGPQEFVEEFSNSHWPQDHMLPEIYYDRRGLSSARGAPVSLHAKCIVIDGRELFVSSANFTSAAQSRNIELGVLLKGAVYAAEVEKFFEDLIKDKICLKAN
jgi:phosphatidylserine/phosphatidylglycerophosphate/cardiolipin synthase-like enzyme